MTNSQKQSVHPAQILEMSRRLDMPFELVEEIVGVVDLGHRLDEVYPLAQQGDEEAQLVTKVLMAELRRRANNYDNFLRSRQGKVI
jgi:hypothetical protein